MQKNKVYFGLLTEVEQEQFKANWENQNKDANFNEFLKMTSSSFWLFVNFAFNWSTTPNNQGVDYWENISNREEPILPIDKTLSHGIDLKKIMVENGLTQEELANKLGINSRTIRYWIQGRAIPLTKQKFINRLFLKQVQTNSGDESLD